MLFLGQIEAPPGSTGIDSVTWLALIDSHASLAHVSPRKGINPCTGEPFEYKAPPSTAIVHAGGTDIGCIEWAMDGSPVLIVQAQKGSVEVVASVAEDVARILAGRFVRDAHEA
jgi:hypothetical protein